VSRSSYDNFTDSKCLYFSLEFVNGGEMFTHIQKQKKRRFDEETTRFFAAETVGAGYMWRAVRWG
jgi:protein kinase A